MIYPVIRTIKNLIVTFNIIEHQSSSETLFETERTIWRRLSLPSIYLKAMEDVKATVISADIFRLIIFVHHTKRPLNISFNNLSAIHQSGIMTPVAVKYRIFACERKRAAFFFCCDRAVFILSTFHCYRAMNSIVVQTDRGAL